MMDRRKFLLAFGAAAILPSVVLPDFIMPGAAMAQEAPSEEMILRRLDAAPQRQVAPQNRVTINEFKRRPELRRAAPSIDIQAINFATGSAEIPRSEYRKVRQIAGAMERILRRRRAVRFLIEGHTDAVGSAYSNQILSDRRAASLKQVLVREFGLPARVLDTVGYGEDYLLVPAERDEWRNRRVTLRRIDDFVR
ncbi:flagellar motor protein MotB [Rhizobium sp. AAP43]|nr:flagellar motor protein MotB [Rhizobium sp. AAP43]